MGVYRTLAVLALIFLVPLRAGAQQTAPAPSVSGEMVYGAARRPRPMANRDKDTTFSPRTRMGGGPYKFVRWAREEELVLGPNETYGGGAPGIKTVVFKP